MLTRRDLLRAQAFARRRSMHAFATGSSDVPTTGVRPARGLLVGALLSVGVLVGALVVNRLGSRPPDQWLEAGSWVVERQTGRQFVVLGDRALTPVPNRASAQLLVGAPGVRNLVVDRRWIRQAKILPARGLQAAPDVRSVRGPEPSWGACLVGRSLGLVAGVRARLQPAGAALAVTGGGVGWLVTASAGGVLTRFRVDHGIEALGRQWQLVPREVPDDWLRLVPQGTPLSLPDPEPVLATSTGFLTSRTHRSTTPFVAGLLEAATGQETRLADPWLRADDALEAPRDWPSQVPVPLAQGVPCVVLPEQASVAADGSPPASTSDRPPPARVLEPQLGVLSAEPGAAIKELASGSAATTVARVPADPSWLVRHGLTPDEAVAVREAPTVVVDEFGACFVLIGQGTQAALGIRAGSGRLLPQEWAALLPRCSPVSRARAGVIEHNNGVASQLYPSTLAP